MNEKAVINGKEYRFIKTITDICNNRIMRRLPESWLMKQPKPQTKMPISIFWSKMPMIVLKIFLMGNSLGR